MMNILLIGAPLSSNFGGPSLFISVLSVFDNIFNEKKYTFVTTLKEDMKFADESGLSIVLAVPVKNLILSALIKKYLKADIGSQQVRCLIKNYLNADIVIDIWGIGFSDSLNKNTFRSSLFSGGRFLVGKLFGKPVIKYTSDLGPFESFWNRYFSRFYFNRTVDLILARNEITKKRLLDIGVKTPIKVCPDTAFILKPQDSPFAEKLSKERQLRPLIGLSVSHMAARQSGNPEEYVEKMAMLADYAISKTDARIYFVPNELSTDQLRDDVHFSHLVIDKMKKNESGEIIPVEKYTAQQIKGIIGQFDIVVASRYHTIVACLSQAIPVLAVGWHTKYDEIMKLFGIENYVCDVKSNTLEELKIYFDEIWNSRDTIVMKIKNKINSVERNIYQCAEEVGYFLKQR